MPAAGPFAVALEQFRQVLAASTVVQTWLSVGDAATALTRILKYRLQPDETRPGENQPDGPGGAAVNYAVIWSELSGGGARPVALNTHVYGGTLFLLLRGVVSAETNDEAAAIETAESSYGEILKAIRDGSGADVSGVRMFFDDIAAVQHPQLVPLEQQAAGGQAAERWEGLISVSWGAA